jgi:glycerol-3-phosphate dehydrogenase
LIDVGVNPLSSPLPLDPSSRAAAIDRLARSVDHPLDLLVVGGGITGAGIALDAADRGMDVAVIDAVDWGSGTSSRSSKLVHGGLRYLKMLDFALVREALRERDLLLTELAPHLVRPAPFVFPLRNQWQRAFVGAGVLLYDLLAGLRPGRRPLPVHRHLGRAALRTAVPSMRKEAAVGAIEYWDATVDDARLVITLIRSAHTAGANAASRIQMRSLRRNPAGVVTGATVRDTDSGRDIEVHARSVIIAAGVWTERAQERGDVANGLKVLASKGVHIVVSRDRIRGDRGLILETARSVLFIIPWSRYWIIGTTDTEWTGNPDTPASTLSDVEYLLDEANRVLSSSLTRDDIIGIFSGLRPLLKPSATRRTAKVSREHTVTSPSPGLSIIAGGKLTTYRVMARDAVDLAARSISVPRSTTVRRPLVGAGDPETVRAALEADRVRFGWSGAIADHLVHRYGTAVDEIVALCDQDLRASLPLQNAPAYLRAEIEHAVRFEGAGTLRDVMERRTRLSYEYVDGAAAAVAEVVAIVGEHLGWSASRVKGESASYLAKVAADARAGETRDEAEAERIISLSSTASWSASLSG